MGFTFKSYSTCRKHPFRDRWVVTLVSRVDRQRAHPVAVLTYLHQCVHEPFIPRCRVERRQEAVSAVASLNRPRDQAHHVQLRVAQHVEQIREHTGPRHQRNERDDRFKFSLRIATWDSQPLHHLTARGDREELGASAVEISHIGRHAVQTVDVGTDRGAQCNLEVLKIATGGGIRCCGNRFQSMLARESPALCESVRMRADRGAIANRKLVNRGRR